MAVLQEDALRAFRQINDCPKCGMSGLFIRRYFETHADLDEFEQLNGKRYARFETRTDHIVLHDLPSDVLGIIMHECSCSYKVFTHTKDYEPITHESVLSLESIALAELDAKRFHKLMQILNGSERVWMLNLKRIIAARATLAALDYERASVYELLDAVPDNPTDQC